MNENNNELMNLDKVNNTQTNEIPKEIQEIEKLSCEKIFTDDYRKKINTSLNNKDVIKWFESNGTIEHLCFFLKKKISNGSKLLMPLMKDKFFKNEGTIINNLIDLLKSQQITVIKELLNTNKDLLIGKIKNQSDECQGAIFIQALHVSAKLPINDTIQVFLKWFNNIKPLEEAIKTLKENNNCSVELLNARIKLLESIITEIKMENIDKDNIAITFLPEEFEYLEFRLSKNKQFIFHMNTVYMHQDQLDLFNKLKGTCNDLKEGINSVKINNKPIIDVDEDRELKRKKTNTQNKTNTTNNNQPRNNNYNQQQTHNQNYILPQIYSQPTQIQIDTTDNIQNEENNNQPQRNQFIVPFYNPNNPSTQGFYNPNNPNTQGFFNNQPNNFNQPNNNIGYNPNIGYK